MHYLKADKGNSLVIMDKCDYESRMKEVIKENDYMTLITNPLNRMVINAKEVIARVVLAFNVFAWQLNVSNPTIPKLHGLPKIHKIILKMRPLFRTLMRLPTS